MKIINFLAVIFLAVFLNPQTAISQGASSFKKCMNDNGTPNDPTDDFPILGCRRLSSFDGRWYDVLQGECDCHITVGGQPYGNMSLEWNDAKTGDLRFLTLSPGMCSQFNDKMTDNGDGTYTFIEYETMDTFTINTLTSIFDIYGNSKSDPSPIQLDRSLVFNTDTTLMGSVLNGISISGLDAQMGLVDLQGTVKHRNINLGGLNINANCSECITAGHNTVNRGVGKNIISGRSVSNFAAYNLGIGIFNYIDTVAGKSITLGTSNSMYSENGAILGDNNRLPKVPNSSILSGSDVRPDTLMDQGSIVSYLYLWGGDNIVDNTTGEDGMTGPNIIDEGLTSSFILTVDTTNVNQVVRQPINELKFKTVSSNYTIQPHKDMVVYADIGCDTISFKSTDARLRIGQIFTIKDIATGSYLSITDIDGALIDGVTSVTFSASREVMRIQWIGGSFQSL